MNIVKRIMDATRSGKIEVKNIFCKEQYSFVWKDPVSTEELAAFERETGYRLPNDYTEFLLLSNGAVLFKSAFEEDGYKLLGLPEIIQETQAMTKAGYSIPEGYYCFCQCLFNDDVLFFDLNQEKNYIVDGDVGYPPSAWKHISGDLNHFLIRLCICNGATYWRW